MFTRYENRKITILRPSGVGILYRVSFGSPASYESDYWCEWCGKTEGRFYSYNYDLDKATDRDSGVPGPLFCSLHCWGQQSGYTDL